MTETTHTSHKKTEGVPEKEKTKDQITPAEQALTLFEKLSSENLPKQEIFARVSALYLKEKIGFLPEITHDKNYGSRQL